jgi:cobalt-zinc-cadmium resistance protein CzcA
VVIGGLISATFLTLVVLPVIYVLFNDRKSSDMKNFKKIIPLLIIFLMPSFSLKGQEAIDQREISLEEAISIALENNYFIENAKLAHMQSEKMKKTAYDLPYPQFNFERGQMNSSLIDNSYSISQSFQFPTIYTSGKKYYNENASYYAQHTYVVKNDIMAAVTSAYFNWLMMYEKKEVLLKLDSIYRDFMHAADLKFQLGESNEMEKILAQAKSKQILIYINENEADIYIAEKALKQLLNVDGNFRPTDTVLTKLSLDGMFQDSTVIQGNPALGYYKQNIVRQEAHLKNQKNHYLPDFQLGYFNMSIDQTPGFQGWYVGLGIPIWMWSNAGRVQAAKLETQIARNIFRDKQMNIKLEFEKLMHEYEKHKKSLEFYEGTALQQSVLIMKNASQSYNFGDISYIEFVQLSSEAIDIIVNYLETLNNYNQTIIQIKHLTGAYLN